MPIGLIKNKMDDNIITNNRVLKIISNIKLTEKYLDKDWYTLKEKKSGKNIKTEIINNFITLECWTSKNSILRKKDNHDIA